MVFLRRSPHRVSEQGQKSKAKLYSSGTRSRKRRRALWHFWRLQLLSETVARLVQATTYSDRREPHFSYRPQSWAAFKHWFWPSIVLEEAGGGGIQEENRAMYTQENQKWDLNLILGAKSQKRSSLPDMMEAIRDISMFLTRFNFSSSYGDTSYSSYAKKAEQRPHLWPSWEFSTYRH